PAAAGCGRPRSGALRDRAMGDRAQRPAPGSGALGRLVVGVLCGPVRAALGGTVLGGRILRRGAGPGCLLDRVGGRFQAADDTEPVLVEGAVAGLARARDGIGRRLRRAVHAAFAVRLDDRLALVILVAGERPVHHLGPHAAVTGAGLIRLPSGRLAGASPPHRYSLNRCRAPDVGPVAVSKAAHAVGPVVPAAVTLSITSVPLVRLCSGRGPSGVACTARRTVRRTAVVRAAATPSDAVSASRRSAPPEEGRGGKRRWAGRFRACGSRWPAASDRGGCARV